MAPGYRPTSPGGLRALALGWAAAVAIGVALPGCGATRGVIGPDGIESRVTETYADGKPRRVERWQGERFIEDRHVYPGGATQHAVRPTADPLVLDVLVFHDDGKTLAMRYFLRKGQMEGVAEQWDKAGKKRAIRTFRDGRPDGLEKRLNEKEEVVAITNWQKGEREGPAYTYHPPSEEVRSASKGGYPMGNVESEIVWSRGVPAETGRSYYDQKTRKLRSEFSLKSGVRHGEERIYSEARSDRVAGRQVWKLGVLHGPSETFYPNGAVMTRVNFVDGQAEGTEQHWHENGQVKFSVPRVHDKREGIATAHDENGAKIAEFTYENDKPVGFMSRFYASGHLLAKIPYVGDDLEGPATFYYAPEEGAPADAPPIVMAKVPFKKGKAEGEEVRFRKDGTVQARVPRIQDSAEGFVKFYDEKEVHVSTVWYENNEAHGLMVAFYPPDPQAEGMQHKSAEGMFAHDKPTGELKLFYKNGKLMATRPHNTTASGLLTRWHDNGKHNSKVELLNGKEEGVEDVYHAEGWLWARRQWANGVMVGEETRYYKSGKVLGIYPIVNGRWNGNAKIYAERGGYLWSELPYDESRKHGTEMRYAKDGKPWATVGWEYDKKLHIHFLRSRQKRESETWYHASSKCKWRELKAIPGVADRKREWRYYDNGSCDKEIEVDRDTAGKWVGDAIFYYKSGAIQARVPFVNGKRQGKELRFYESGEKWMEIPYVDDEPRGDAVSYRPDGTVAARFPVAKANAEGIEVQYHEDGQVRMTVPIVNDKRHGIARLQNARGSEVARTSYLKGQQVGFEILYYDNGHASHLASQVHGLRQGAGVAFGNDGQRWAIMPWKDGQKHGTERKFGPDGQEVVEETVYRDGKPVESRTFKSGQPMAPAGKAQPSGPPAAAEPPPASPPAAPSAPPQDR